MLIKRNRKLTFFFLIIFCFTFAMIPAFSFAASDTADDTGTVEAQEAEDLLPEDEKQNLAAPEQSAPDIEIEPGEEEEDRAEGPETGPEESPGCENLDAFEETEKEEVSFNADKRDYLVYDPLYIAQFADPEYVDVSEVDMERYVNVVTAAKGIATYNIRKQNDFDVTESNYIAGMNYEMPVYDVDENSDYYIAVPDVNLFNENFSSYDLMVAYNNDFAEMISGYRYEKGILYIPKPAIDHPKNESSVPEGSAIAVQMNYAVGEDMSFTKSIPVQILKDYEPVGMTVYADNLFEPGITVKTGVKNRREEDISVFLNGQMIPVNDSSWTYDKGSGRLYIHEMPGVVSSINVVFRNRSVLETVKDEAVSVLESIVPESYAAGIPTDDMEFFRTPGGEKVVLKISGGDLFVGWRGHYTAAKIIHGRQGSQTHKQAEAAKKKLKGWLNSVQYLYGGYTDLTGAGTSLLGTDAKKKQFDARIAATWAISSYALGADAGLMNDDGKLTKNKLVTHNVPVASGSTTTYNTTEQHTIYEWLLKYQNQIKKSNGATANNKNNGIAGATNFAVTFPDSIQGSALPLASSGVNTGRYNDNIMITSANMDSSYYMAASCNHLDDVAASDKDTDMYVTCLSLTDSYAVLAFAQARGGQNACAIYKFAIEPQPAPSIGTTAAVSDDNSVVTDSIAYGNLQANHKYVFRGWLVDTETGEKIPDSDGKIDLNSGDSTSGSVEMQMDASKYDGMDGHSITAFEELYVIINTDSGEREVLVAEHKDRTGNAETNPQTVEICQDIKLRKYVGGTDGDHEKQFAFTAEFTGLVPGRAYTVEGADEKTFMADESGKAVLPVKLSDGQEAVIRGVPKGAKYLVTEEASDHAAEYRLISEDMADNGARIASTEGSNGNEVYRTLATAEETVDLFDGTVAIEFCNNREKQENTFGDRNFPDTGDSGEMMIYLAVMAASACALILFVVLEEKSKKSL